MWLFRVTSCLSAAFALLFVLVAAETHNALMFSVVVYMYFMPCYMQAIHIRRILIRLHGRRQTFWETSNFGQPRFKQISIFFLFI